MPAQSVVFIEQLSAVTGPVWAGALFAALTSVLLSHRFLRRRRLIVDIPTSKTQGVFVGLVEVHGTAECERPLRSHLAEISCVYFSYTVEEHWARWVTVTTTDAKGNRTTSRRRESGWTTVADDGRFIDFYLRDDTGVLRIVPDGAEVHLRPVFSRECDEANPLYYAKGPPGAIGDSTGRRRFNERAIPLHAPVEIIGRAREREDVVAAEIARDKSAPIYIISTKPLDAVAADENLYGWLCLLLLPVLMIIGLVIMEKSSGGAPPGIPAFCVTMIFIQAALWLCGWFWNVYNALADLRNRVSRGRAQIEVLLQLRADLIPNLVACVQGFKSHESPVQESVAAMRNQLSMTAPGVSGGDADGVSGRLIALAEAYPELKADATFGALSRSLAECEARLALARGYYNDIATGYNTRIAVFPDNLWAGLTGFGPVALWQADGLSRQPVRVNFATE